MVLRVADRLSTERRRRLVGRLPERELFQGAMRAPALPFQLLYVYGPGGVGKTTLLREFASLCDEAGTPACYVDARDVEPAPASFVHALSMALGLERSAHPGEYLAAHSGRYVLLIDTYETLAPLDGWLRDDFLPRLPDQVLTVLAGRQPPPPGWRADSGWQALTRVLPLRNLTADESRAYLSGRAVPLDQLQAVLDFTHGHPLALSLIADAFAQRPDMQFQPEVAPDVIKSLLEQLVQKVPGPAHRAALEASGLVHVTTESLLGEMLGMPDAHELFEWLRGLSLIESGRLGLFPHDLAREALAADVRWRNPDWYAELHRRARNYYTTRVQQVGEQEQQRLLFDLIFLHRDNPVMRPFFEWQESGGLLAEVPREQDWPTLRDMVARHEGEESQRLAEYWFARQPEGVVLFREAGQPPAGLLAMVALERASPEDMHQDPAAAAAWRYLERHAPLRPGEAATIFRFWMARESYQAVSAVQSLIFVNVVRHYLTTPRLAFSLFPCADSKFWAPMFAYGELPRIPDADFEVGSRRYGVYGHDWRVMPPAAWLAVLAEREIAAGTQSLPPARAPEPLLVLSQPDFTVAVHDALRALPRADALGVNPLLRSRVVLDRTGSPAGAAERVAALQALVTEAATSLAVSPRGAKCYRALYHTYLQPAPTQEQAADLLDLPFSTYRRHLTTGVALVTDHLWRRELGEPAEQAAH